LPSSGAPSPAGDPAHGKALFSQHCAQCHGANGVEGGVGPSLRNEKSRKNVTQTIAWIKDPEPPMPKLYPAPLGEKDVADVAAFLMSL
jgi:mono/diheme cytochrome c family protein